MFDLLMLLANECYFLFRDHKARIVDSNILRHCDSAMIALEINDCRLLFAKEKRCIELLVGPKSSGRKVEVYAIGLVRELLTGVQGTAVLDNDNIEFLNSCVSEVVDLFKSNKVEQTRLQIKTLRQRRESK